MTGPGKRNDGFDATAAVTRSLLGWGVAAGSFYLVVGLALALTRPGFDLARHQLSLPMLGDFGWLQAANLILSGLMTVAAAFGFARALRGSAAAPWSAALLGVYGMCLVGSGIFPPDPMAGFPAGAPEVASTSGLLHLALGALGFLALAAAALVTAGWFGRRGDRGMATYSRISGAVVIVGFAAGAALAALPVGVACLWIAVVAGWAWLLVASVVRTAPRCRPSHRDPGVSERRPVSRSSRSNSRSPRCAASGRPCRTAWSATPTRTWRSSSSNVASSSIAGRSVNRSSSRRARASAASTASEGRGPAGLLEADQVVDGDPGESGDLLAAKTRPSSGAPRRSSGSPPWLRTAPPVPTSAPRAPSPGDPDQEVDRAAGAVDVARAPAQR